MRAVRTAALIGAVATTVMAPAPAALAQNSTVDATMTPNYYVEARIYKDLGNGDPTHWSTSAWTYHGAAVQRMTRIRDTATVQVWGGSGFSGSCSSGFSGETPSFSCQNNYNTTSSTESMYWENGNTYESDLSGVVHPTYGTYWMKVCSIASAYSSPLGIHGSVTACVG